MKLNLIKYFQISCISCFWLSALWAQPFYFEFELNQEFRLNKVLAIIDPYTHSTEVIWTHGDSFNLHDLIVESIPVLIRKDCFTKNGKEWVVIEDYFGVSNKIIDDIEYTAVELRILFDNIEVLMYWTEKELGNKKGDFTYNWSKGAINEINTFLLKPNERIIIELLTPNNSLSELEYYSIDFWLWVRKYSLYLYNPTVLIDIDSIYTENNNYRSNQSLFTLLLPKMRISNYKQLMSFNLDEITLNELTINNCDKNSQLHTFYYSSFLYCLKKYFPNYSMNNISSVSNDTILIDTNQLTQNNLPIFNYVLEMYRHKDVYVNMDFRFIDQSLSSTSINELLDAKVIVLEFWGTWCKPCLKSMPLYLELATKYRGTIPFISIAIDESQKWLKFINSNHLSSTVQLLSKEDISGFYTPGISIFPTYMVIDEHGKIISNPVNYIEELKTILEDLGSQ